jgi:hypothetical protein
MKHQRYCLDANVLIVAWHTYYSPHVCPSYWELMNKLGEQNLIFLPDQVYEELGKTDDDLLKWIKSGKIPIEKTDTPVAECLRSIYTTNPIHVRLVDSAKGRSLADPWVIAHAMRHNACVVTKENKITTSSDKIKIPNVCDNMGVRWIDDFQFGRDIGIKFTCTM